MLQLQAYTRAGVRLFFGALPRYDMGGDLEKPEDDVATGSKAMVDMA